MEVFILIIIGVVGVLLGFTLGRVDAHRHLSTFVNKERYPKKERRKQMLLKHLKDRRRITNDEVEELLGVSDATATRYFDELEEEGEIVQKGEGRGTYYELT